MTNILGIFIVFFVVAYLGYYLWVSNGDQGPDVYKIYDEMVIREYEGQFEAEVQPTEDFGESPESGTLQSKGE